MYKPSRRWSQRAIISIPTTMSSGNSITSSSESYDDHARLIRTDSLSTVSTTATAPNLPGAGRTVGLALEWFGGRVEEIANSVATRRGLGPDAVARDIHLLCRHDLTSFSYRHHSPMRVLSTAEHKTLKKLCRKLLNYAR